MVTGRVIRTEYEDIDKKIPFNDGSNEKIYEFPSIPNVGLEIGIPSHTEEDHFSLYTVHHVSWYPTDLMEVFVH